MRKSFWIAQFFALCSLAGLLLSGCGNVAAQQKKEEPELWCNGTDACTDKMRQFGNPTMGPVDVPPKEWNGPDRLRDAELKLVCADSAKPFLSEEQKAIAEIACEEPVHHRTCEDTSRFLMQSVDKQWHCLKLTPAANPALPEAEKK